MSSAGALLPIPRTRDMDDLDKPPQLRTAGSDADAAAAPGEPIKAPFAINKVTELVADLIEATALLTPDKLALVRGRAGQGSLAEAIVAEGVASGDGIARTLASRFGMPLVDLALAGVDPEASKVVPLHVLERVVAMPYAIQDG